MIFRSLVTLACLLPIPAFALDMLENKTCHLDGQTRLEQPTQIFCDGDMVVEDGAEIITEGHELQIWVTGKAYFGGASKGFQIRSFDESSVAVSELADPSGKRVLIYALSASGYLKIDNSGLAEQDLGGDVALEYGSTRDYDHELFTGQYADAKMLRGGDAVALIGAAHKPVN